MAESKGNVSESAIRAWARLQRVAPALLDAVEADLKARKLPPLAWYDALLELKRAGDRGLRPYELQEEMLLAQYSVSRLADRLVESGYAVRRPCPEDARGQVLAITAEGRALLRRMWPVYRDAISRHFAARISATDAGALSRILGKLS
jgi:DNA-binding MarR family transcriptional regulator